MNVVILFLKKCLRQQSIHVMILSSLYNTIHCIKSKLKVKVKVIIYDF